MDIGSKSAVLESASIGLWR